MFKTLTPLYILFIIVSSIGLLVFIGIQLSMGEEIISTISTSLVSSIIGYSIAKVKYIKK